MADMTQEVVQRNYLLLQTEIARACAEENIDTSQLKVIAVSKMQSAEKIRWLLELGHTHFGENRSEEVEKKWPGLLADFPHARLHFIGPIQSKKIAKIIKYCHCIHSLDRLEVAKKIVLECQKQNKQIDCLVQINIGNEIQKAGIPTTELASFLKECHDIIQLKPEGLMCIPPIDKDPLAFFMTMKNLQQQHRLAELSMGMSNDYQQAILAGATMIRVGSKIFGDRI